MWTQLVSELVDHCMANPSVKGRNPYDTLGRWIVTRYPCVKREGTRSWVSILFCIFSFVQVAIVKGMRRLKGVVFVKYVWQSKPKNGA